MPDMNSDADERPSNPATSYHHVQRGQLHTLLVATAIGLCLFISSKNAPAEAVAIVYVACVILVLLAFCFAKLTIFDDGDRLVARFGPIPLFGVSVPFSDMESVQPTRSGIIDGWGVHYTLGRGWIYNLWGFGCVRFQLHNRVVRIGTDEPEVLATYVRSRMSSNAGE